MVNITYVIVSFLVLLGVYSLGYYIGHKDGTTEGAQMVLDVAAELWEQLISMSTNQKK